MFVLFPIYLLNSASGCKPLC